jgi:predicted metal-dependent peptidase
MKLDKHLEKASAVFPYLPYILRRVDIGTSSSKPSCMAWTKDGTISININPDQANTDEKFELILLHEIGHIIYAAHLFKDDPRSKENKKLVNIAMDLIINETIIDFDKNYANVINDLSGFTFELIKSNFGVDLNLEMTWMEIYDKLKPFCKKIYVRDLIDSHSEDSEDGESDVDEDKSNTPDISKEIVDSLLNDPKIAASIKGLNINEIKLKAATKAKNDKFKMMLSKYTGSLVNYNKKQSLLRPNKRSEMPFKGYRKDKQLKALIAVDTSGSIDYYKKELDMSFAVIYNYIDSVDILPFSDKAGEMIKDAKKMPDFQASGGENFQVIEPYIKDYDVVVVVSDLICVPPTFKEDNVIYLSKNSPDWVKNKKHIVI